jgi:hypothetical protein
MASAKYARFNGFDYGFNAVVEIRVKNRFLD